MLILTSRKTKRGLSHVGDTADFRDTTKNINNKQKEIPHELTVLRMCSERNTELSIPKEQVWYQRVCGLLC